MCCPGGWFWALCTSDYLLYSAVQCCILSHLGFTMPPDCVHTRGPLLRPCPSCRASALRSRMCIMLGVVYTLLSAFASCFRQQLLSPAAAFASCASSCVFCPRIQPTCTCSLPPFPILAVSCTLKNLVRRTHSPSCVDQCYIHSCPTLPPGNHLMMHAAEQSNAKVSGRLK